MIIVFRADAWADYLTWQDEDRKIVRKINLLIRESTRDPFKGIGKPEPLRENLKGWWSRRIDQEHRFIYRFTNAGEFQQLEILSCRYHY